MRAVVQRVSRAKVTVNGSVAGEIDKGLAILLGVSSEDTERDAEILADKMSGLRIFPDDNGKMDRSLIEAGGGVLVISQFTLYADTRRGRRPSFIRAASGETAERLYNYFVRSLEGRGLTVATGVFGAMMDVELVNNGPVTIILDTNEWK